MAGSVQVALLLLVGLVGALATDGNMAASGYSANWEQGHATWYGDPYGEGSTGNDSPSESRCILCAGPSGIQFVWWRTSYVT